jgi:hypothetical protein
MSHHGPNPFDGEHEGIRRLLAEMKASSANYRGPIGAYPDGMLTKQDEGSIQFAVGEAGDRVIIDFGSPVTWVGMTAQQAMDLAASLMSQARKTARKNGETVHVTIG